MKINKENNIYEENHINDEYLYDSDPEFSENKLKQILIGSDDNYSNIKDIIGTKKSEWDKLKLFPYNEWVKEHFSFKYAEKNI